MLIRESSLGNLNDWTVGPLFYFFETPRSLKVGCLLQALDGLYGSGKCNGVYHAGIPSDLASAIVHLNDHVLRGATDSQNPDKQTRIKTLLKRIATLTVLDSSTLETLFTKFSSPKPSLSSFSRFLDATDAFLLQRFTKAELLALGIRSLNHKGEPCDSTLESKELTELTEAIV